MSLRNAVRLICFSVFTFTFLGWVHWTAAAIEIPIDNFDAGPSENWVWFDTNIEFNLDGTPRIDETGNLVPRAWGPGTIGVADGAINLGTASPVPPLDPPQSPPDPAFFDTFNSGLLGGSWGPSATDLTFSNGLIRALVRADDGSNVDLLLRGQADFSSYVMSGITSFEEVHFSLTGPTGVARYVPIPDLKFTANEDWWMEFGAIGSELTLKAWKASESEPAEPQLTLTDETLPFGAIGISASVSNNNIGSATATNSFLDDVTFTHVLPESLLPLDCDASQRITTADLDCSVEPTIAPTLGVLMLPLGDLNLNGEVAFDDFLILAQHFGSQTTKYTEGDINRNGEVDFRDFLQLAFGITSMSNIEAANAQSVPEPHGACSALFFIVAILINRERGRGR